MDLLLFMRFAMGCWFTGEFGLVLLVSLGLLILACCWWMVFGWLVVYYCVLGCLVLIVLVLGLIGGEFVDCAY